MSDTSPQEKLFLANAERVMLQSAAERLLLRHLGFTRAVNAVFVLYLDTKEQLQELKRAKVVLAAEYEVARDFYRMIAPRRQHLMRGLAHVCQQLVAVKARIEENQKAIHALEEEVDCVKSATILEFPHVRPL